MIATLTSYDENQAVVYQGTREYPDSSLLWEHIGCQQNNQRTVRVRVETDQGVEYRSGFLSLDIQPLFHALASFSRIAAQLGRAVLVTGGQLLGGGRTGEVCEHRQQRGGVQRFGHATVSAQHVGLLSIARRDARAEDHRHQVRPVGPRGQPLQYSQAADSRHVEIQEHHLWVRIMNPIIERRLPLQVLDGLLTVRNKNQRHAHNDLGKGSFEQQHIVRVILRDQDNQVPAVHCRFCTHDQAKLSLLLRCSQGFLNGVNTPSSRDLYLRRDRLSLYPGQFDPKLAAFGRLGFQPDAAAHAFGGAADNGQADAVAFVTIVGPLE